MNGENSIMRTFLQFLQILFFTVAIMYFSKALFVPLAFALLIAFILLPFCKRLESKNWSRLLAIAASLMLVIFCFVLIGWLLVWQISYLGNEIPMLLQKVKSTLPSIHQWLTDRLGITFTSEAGWLENAFRGSGNEISSFIKSILKNAGSILFSLFIIPVFTSLFLYHREQFVQFLKSFLPEAYQERLITILHEASYAYYKYIIGLLKVYLIVGALNSIGLLLLGVKYAILFGMLTAFMTMIPYVGIIISSMLPIAMAWITTNSLFYPMAIIGIFAFVQYLENSVIFPKVVGQQLNVSTWAILVALMAGGMLWGVSGMVLFMPFVAILKIISGHIEYLKPLNILLSRAAPIK